MSIEIMNVRHARLKGIFIELAIPVMDFNLVKYI